MAQLSAGFGYEYYTAPRRVSVAPKKIQSLDQLTIAKTKLKEASMWACRAVFQPEEKY